MNRLSRSRRGLVGGILLLLLAALTWAAVAFADTVNNDIAANPGSDMFTAGGSTSVGYKVVSNSAAGDTQTGCNAADSSPATVTINAPAGVTANPGSLDFTECNTFQEVTFSSSTPGDYSITVSVSDSGTGSYSTGPASFTLHVLAAANAGPTVGAITGDTSANEGQTKSYSVSASDPDGDALSYAWSVTSGNASITGSNGASASVDFTDGPSTVGLQVVVSDGQGHSVTKTLSVTENNVAPTLSALSLTGNSATACSAGNSVGLDFTFSDPAAANDAPYAGSIDWGDGSTTDPFSSSPVRKSHTYAAGAYTIKVDVSDEDGGNATQKTGSVSLLYNNSGILQPINANGSSVFKNGSTIPVKVRITDCNSSPVAGLAPDISAVKLDGTTESAVNEDISSTSAADTGAEMRYDATAGQYIYNLATKSLSGQGTYRVKVSDSTISSPVVGQFDIKK